MNDTGEKMTIAESSTVSEGEGIDYAIHVPNHVWTLSIVTEKGWNEWGLVTAILMAGLLISLLLSVVIFQWQERTRVLRRIAVTDELTGLYNRRHLNKTIDKWCRKGREPFTLFYMDLDCFKKINDTLGHHWGDVVLIEAAKRIAAALGSNALLARVGGDEFVAAQTDVNGTNHATMEHIHQVFAKPFLLEDEKLMVGVSTGCTGQMSECIRKNRTGISDGKYINDGWLTANLSFGFGKEEDNGVTIDCQGMCGRILPCMV